MSKRVLLRLVVVAVAVCALLIISAVLPAAGNRDGAFERVREVQAKHTSRLMAIEGVEGTAIGVDQADQPVLKVFAERSGVAGVPKKIEDVAVEVVVTGKFYALPRGAGKPNPGGSRVNPAGRFARPVPIGVSTGNEGECSSGTIACRVSKGVQVYALSNNHVYARENNAPIGSKVLQPGRYDTGCAVNPNDVIGTLDAFVPISFSTDNKVDAAIASTTTTLLGNATPSNGYGVPSSTTLAASLGQSVQKYGRTTSLTKGVISNTNATVRVTYSSGTATFVEQIVVSSRGSFIKAGDSGSLLVTATGKNPVGLLFAGNSSGTYSVANKIDDVLGALGGVSIDGN